MFPQSTYRSESAKELAEKVAKEDAVNSLNITVGIDQVLKNRSVADIMEVAQAIAENRSFVLINDKNHYCIVIPSKFVVACYVDGVQKVMEVMKDAKQFQNRVKMAFVVYGKFCPIDRHIESGRNGNAEIPEVAGGAEVQDGTGHDESTQGKLSQTIIRTI